MSKLLGTAVGIALQNHEAIREAGAPAMNAVGGVFQVIWRTMWKSTLIGLGLMVVWFVSFVFTYLLGGSAILASPVFMFPFGIFMFVIMPAIVMVREGRRVGKTVAAKNDAQRAMAQQEHFAREQQHAQAVTNWQAQQGIPAQPQYQPQGQYQH